MLVVLRGVCVCPLVLDLIDDLLVVWSLCLSRLANMNYIDFRHFSIMMNIPLWTCLPLGWFILLIRYHVALRTVMIDCLMWRCVWDIVHRKQLPYLLYHMRFLWNFTNTGWHFFCFVTCLFSVCFTKYINTGWGVCALGHYFFTCPAVPVGYSMRAAAWFHVRCSLWRLVSGHHCYRAGRWRPTPLRPPPNESSLQNTQVSPPW